MSRTAAKFTQADVARSLRAAKQAGAGSVEVRPDGTIVIHIDRRDETETAPKALEPHLRPVL